MSSHAFIFKPGSWEGEGTITFSMADDALHFTMNWVVLPAEEGVIYFHQTIQVDSFSDEMRNHFCISKIDEAKFQIQLENHLVGKVFGTGLVSDKIIAWEFRDPKQEFEGFEIYELQEDGIYQMRAEFTAGEGFRTYVRGYIEKSLTED